MAIGSNPEVGKNFGVMKDMSPEQIEEWFAYMRENWQPWLHAGWATLIHKKENNPFYTKVESQQSGSNGI